MFTALGSFLLLRRQSARFLCAMSNIGSGWLSEPPGEDSTKMEGV